MILILSKQQGSLSWMLVPWLASSLFQGQLGFLVEDRMVPRGAVPG